MTFGMTFVHVIYPFRRTCENNMQSFIVCVSCCAQNIKKVELSVIVEGILQNAFRIAL
jgi:hypothetical protein